ncbi:MAG: tetratricopeptide repeat protein [Pseudomonadota bacterium]
MNSKTIELDPERWSRAEALFAAAAELDGPERERFLNENVADDPELGSYVRALLDSDQAGDGQVSAAVASVAGEALTTENGIEGELIGPYRVERLLGAGGMGMVYLARRADEQFDQQVAIKLGQHRLVDPETVERLRAERQILSDLQHPNIARLFDGGTTADGVPYLVMEYIDGVRLDTYCDRERLSITERLELFRTICAAVHYAHQNLVVHRDIKASNILVAADGVPKLLDFGIAKLVDTEGAATVGLTREGAVVMTPENAAPEQVKGRTVTTATDTYALGLLLFRLLAGLPALPIGEQTPAQIAAVVCETPVIPPSRRLARLNDAAGNEAALREQLRTIGADRGTSAERLARRLRGDLDTIVLNTLRKEPGRRYQSVAGLSQDIELHMRSMPIRARADSWRYRSGKFIRRHYVAVSASVIAALVLVGFAVTVTVQNQRILAERDRAQEVSRFLEDVFTAPDPTRANGAEITARELLDVGANRIRGGLGRSPEIQSDLMATMGRVYFNLGIYGPSAELLEEALKQKLDLYGEGHPVVAATQNDLARTLIWRAEYTRAQELLTNALSTSQRFHGPQSPEVAGILENAAELHLETGELLLAEQHAEDSIDIFAALGSAHTLDLVRLNALLARILQVRGDLDRTETLLRDAIALVESMDTAHDDKLAYYQQNLAVLLRSRGEFDAAAEVLEEAVATTRRVFGDSHDLLAAILMDQGTLLHRRGRLEAAEVVMRDALAQNISNRGANHPFVGVDMILLGMLLHDRGEHAEALEMLSDAQAIFEATPEPENQYTASALTERGAVLTSMNRLDEALPVLERAIRIRERDYVDGDALLAATRTEYADVLGRLGEFKRAEAMLIDCVETLGGQPGRRADRAEAALARLYLAREQSLQ